MSNEPQHPTENGKKVLVADRKEHSTYAEREGTETVIVYGCAAKEYLISISIV
jgi:hypothetical protein